MTDAVRIYTEDISYIKTTLQQLRTIDFVDDVENADIVLSYGGDGTLLKTFRMLCDNNMHDMVLLAGLNKGTVGFMANDIPDLDFVDAVVQAFNKKSLGGDIQERQILRIESSYPSKLVETKALNEIVIQPRDRGKLFECNVYISVPSMGINSEKITYSGDGVIICTASGSTAYNLSAGGPILLPNSKSIIISPICPFTMAGRSVILPGDAFIQVTTEYPDYVSIDGMTTQNDTEMISICSDPDTLMLFKQDNFFRTIQEKLGWNRSIK